MGLCSFHLAKKYFKGSAKLTTHAFKKGEATLAALDRMRMARQQDQPHPPFCEFDKLKPNEVLLPDFVQRHSHFFNDERSLLALRFLCRFHAVRRYASSEWQMHWANSTLPLRPQISSSDRQICMTVLEEAVSTVYIYDLLVLLAWFLGRITREDIDRFKNVPRKYWPANIQRDEIDADAWWTYHYDMISRYRAQYAKLDEDEKEAQPDEHKSSAHSPPRPRKTRKRIRFISDYQVWFKRTVRSNHHGKARVHVLPAVFAPVSYLLWLTRKVLQLDRGTVRRIQGDIRAMRFLNIAHQQGQWLSHLAFYSRELFSTLLCVSAPPLHTIDLRWAPVHCTVGSPAYDPSTPQFFTRFVMANKPRMQQHTYVTGEVDQPTCHLGQMDVERLNRELNRAGLYDQRHDLLTAHQNLDMLFCHLNYKVMQYWLREGRKPPRSHTRNHPNYTTLLEKPENKQYRDQLNSVFQAALSFDEPYRAFLHRDEHMDHKDSYLLCGVISRNSKVVRNRLYARVLNNNLHGRDLQKQREKGDLSSAYRDAVVLFAEGTKHTQISKVLISEVKKYLETELEMKKVSREDILQILARMPRFRNRDELFD